MYWFKETERAKVLQGRTIKYLANNKLFITQNYLSQIFNGKRGCSKRLAQSITKCISYDALLEDYFIRKEN